MEFSKKWLCEILGASHDTKQLVDQLTMLGLEVDSVRAAGGAFRDVVVGEITAAEPHPDAKRLRCCTVSIGDKDALNIVCGGVNARAGIKVACAKVGAVLPSGMVIKSTELRGQPSCGMLCSSSELGLIGAEDPDGGIMELPLDAPLGLDVRALLDLDDEIIDIELTPNRGDCASLWGIAREVAVVQENPISLESAMPVDATLSETQGLRVDASAACPRYLGRIIRGISQAAVTPLWLKERLRRSGLRPIHPVVDILNYVMLECGQPMHAFDLSHLRGDVVVRFAKAGERIELLNAQEATLTEVNLIIADEDKPLAVAGVMGGAQAGVSNETEDVFLEAAFFDPIVVRRSGSVLNLNSDSRYRFERGVDYEIQAQAMERATELIVSICGGQVGPVAEQCSHNHLPQSSFIELRLKRILRVLGVEIERDRISHIFERLGFQPRSVADGWRITVPSFRFDLHIEVDLIEELARIHGYNNIPNRDQAISAPMVERTEKVSPLSRLKHHLTSRGYNEVITYSFISQAMQASFCPDQAQIQLLNPISKDLEIMRGSLWPSLVGAMLYNQNRQAHRARFIEVGRVYQKKDDRIQQPMMLGLLASGSLYPEQWDKPSAPVDFFDVKKDVESLLSLGGRLDQFRWERCAHPALHPGQSAALIHKGEVVGYLGRLHPSLGERLGCIKLPIVFEALLAALQSSAVPSFQSVSKFPHIRRDLALLLSEEVPAADVVRAAHDIVGDLLSHVEIFDIYQGEGIDLGQKSLALGLTFQDPSRTLIDSEVDTAFGNVVTGLEQRFNATMRT